MSFSVISEIFPLFWVGVQNFPFLTTWPKKRAPKKHYKNRGFSILFFWKTHMRHETAIFGPKKPKFINSSYHFFLLVFFSLNNRKHKKCRNPYFYSVLANQKKREFSNFILKTLKIEKPNFCTLFLKKAIFRKLPDNWAQKKTQNDN